ncbi:MAG: putative rane protein [Herbinix sp.]|jgi:YYY domain-containing protein|nr:putative rane protein [Herbinix sp.]
MIKKVLYFITAIILAIIGKLLLQGDYIPFLQWWVTIAIIGVIFLPLTTLIFGSFHDKGYLFSKTIGIGITGYIMWFLSSVHVMKFTEVSCIISVVISLLFNIIILLLKKKYKANNTQDNDSARTIIKDGTLNAMITEELVFFGVFLLFTYIRGFKPEAYGTEKFMDYGFMTSMMRSEYMPPQDFWFSGTKINYYYVGQYLATFLTKLSFVKVSYGYNLMLMMVGAFAFVLSYSLAYNVMLQFIKDQGKKIKLIPWLSGIIAGAGVCIAGNMHYPTYQWFEPAVRKFFGMEASTEKYWFPDATRFIGYHPETADKTIHEFPAYSFVLGDLHAHVINILFVLTVLGILFAWLSTRKAILETKTSILKEVFHPAIFLLAFFIGLYHTTNYWDFPIYFVVSGGVILFSNLVVYNFKGKAFGVTGLQGIFVFIFSEIICLPFTLNFDQISTNICLVVAHTPLNQMIILWGLPVITVLCFLSFLIANFAKKRREIQQAEHIKQRLAFFQFFETLSTSDLFIIVLGLCAIGLILIPEVVYVEDIYSGDYKRANTMFKLTYQAFIMFGISFGYIFLRLICFGKSLRQRAYAGIGLILFTLSLFYVQNAVNSWYGNIFDREGYKGLDAAAFMENEMPDDKLGTDWLNENITGTPVVLEANGDSYTDYQRISVITGLPTVLGWHTHEWLWKSDVTLLDERAADIQQIYSSTDEAEVRDLLDKYQVSYIYVGKLEEEKYEVINHDLLKSLGEVVFISPATAEKEYETYIVQIKY